MTIENRSTDSELGREQRDASSAGGAAGYAYRGRTVIELRAAGEGAKMPGLRGYTAVFDSWSERLGFFEDFREKIDSGAFDLAITEDDVRALFNHNPDNIFARLRSDADGKRAGTLALGTDSAGLEFDVPQLPDSTLGRDLAEMVEREDVDGCSFGFRTVRDEWQYERPADAPDDGGEVEAWRTLLEVRLFDVGPVVYPAYPETTAEVRSKIAGLRANRDADRTAERVWARSYRHRLAELEARGGVRLG